LVRSVSWKRKLRSMVWSGESVRLSLERERERRVKGQLLKMFSFKRKRQKRKRQRKETRKGNRCGSDVHEKLSGKDVQVANGFYVGVDQCPSLQNVEFSPKLFDDLEDIVDDDVEKSLKEHRGVFRRSEQST
jgi:hypothetical protein